MWCEIPLGVLVGPTELRRLCREPLTITFVCCCGSHHDDRPESASFIGCGAAWNQDFEVAQRPVGKPPESRRALRPATTTEAEWAAQIKQLAATPLARIRNSANQWRNGVTGLTAALAAVALLRGPGTASGLHQLAKWLTLVFSALGFALLLIGSFSVLRASFGSSGYDQQFMSTRELRKYERRRGREALSSIERTRILALAGVVFVAVGAACAFINPG
jgi:hypothetical protein